MIDGTLRYESRATAGPMHTASSAKRTCSASVSTSECTATARRPSSLHARTMRNAISPRFAIKTFLNMRATLASAALLDLEQLLAELDRLAVLHQDLGDRAFDVALDFVHQLHRFDNAE